jgi:hypothetical protein
MLQLTIDYRKSLSVSLISILTLFPFAGQAMQSSNYMIDQDSINFGGTEGSASSNYGTSDALGGVGTGETGEHCSAMSFDGVDGKVVVGDVSSSDWTSVSTSAWVYRTANGLNGYAGVYYKGMGSDLDLGRLLIADDGHLLVQNGNGDFTSGANDVPRNVWTHIVYTYDQSAGQEYLYVDGQLKGQKARTGNIVQNSIPMWIGFGSNSNYMFSGILDDVRVYSRALSSAEVAALYAGTSMSSIGLAGYWGFDDGAGTTVNDLSGQGHTGTVQGGATFSLTNYPPATCKLLGAGYRQTDQSYVAISAPAPVTMSPAIAGLSGGTGNGLATWKVTTNSTTGYEMSVRADTAPALTAGAYSFADYTPATDGIPDFAWGVDDAASEFGYTIEGADTIARFKDDGSACNAGAGNISSACWLNFTTSDFSVADATLPNQPLGTDTTIRFRAQSGPRHVQANGTYTATIVVTALAL